MEKIGESLIIFSITFIVALLVYLVFINRRRLKKNKPKLIMEISYLIGKFKLDEKKIVLKEMLNVTAVLNAFIIAFVGTLVAAVPLHIMWTMMIGFVLVFGMIYAVYEIYGRTLVKKGWQKNDKLEKLVKKKGDKNV